MHVIVDGYNFIRQSESLRPFERVSLERGRQELVRRLAEYKKIRNHRITVVFDGWMAGPPAEERDRQGGIGIIYSRKGEKADEVIKRMARQGGEEMVIVTSDRDIQSTVLRCGGAVIASRDFEDRLARSKFSPSPKPADQEEDEDPSSHEGTKKRGPSRRVSKRKRTEFSRLKKL